MAIDADLNAGIIDEREARRRRQEIASEADFYGAMDGASKFVRGDAIAGIIITVINILGGLYVGMVEGGLPLVECAKIYTTLTIGDGLASQIPAFIVSVGAGMLVTRSTGRTNLGEEVLGQLLAKPIAMFLAAGFLGVLMLTPLPKFPLMTMASGCVLIALYLRRTQAMAVARQVADERTKAQAKPEKIENQLNVDPLELQVGFALVKLVDRGRGGDVLDRIAGLRRQVAADLGLVVPPVRIRDNGELPPNEYAVLLRGQEIARGQLYPDQVLAIDSGLAGQPLVGTEVREPAFGLRAWWLAPDHRDQAERLNYTVVEPSGVLATHLTELIKRYACDLLSRSGTQSLLDNLKQRNPGLVDEVVPNLLKTGEVQKVLQNLLRERVPIRDLETVLEALGDWAPKTKDLEILNEYARNALARTICSQYRDANGVLHAITLDPATEDYIQANIQRLEHGSTITLPPEAQGQLATAVRRQVEQAASSAGGVPIVVLCSPQTRMWVRRIIEPMLPQTPVMALNEIIRGVDVQAHGVASIQPAGADVSSAVPA
jgi:flagellar biosynthesis protein FlhA